MRGEPDLALFCSCAESLPHPQPPPGRVIDPGSFGLLLYVGGRWSAECSERREDVRELEQWASGLPTLLTLLRSSDAHSAPCETAQGSLCVKFGRLRWQDLPALHELRRELERELKSPQGLAFVQHMAGVDDVPAVELVSVIISDASVEMPAKAISVAPPLSGRVYVSLFRVEPGGKGAAELSDILTSPLELFRRAHWAQQRFGLVALSETTPLSLARLLTSGVRSFLFGGKVSSDRS
jgi:hypothetical protein